MLANRLMESLFPMDCKQFMFRNIHFLIFMVLDFSLKIKSASINICTKFSMDENGKKDLENG